MVKNTIKMAIIILLIYVWLPLDAHDLFLTPFLIGIFGLQLYIIISIAMVVYLWNTIEGKGLSGKLNTVKRELKSLTR